jgi:uncharacterized protein YukE
MTILHMESDEVRRAADQFYHLTTEIDENLGRLQRALTHLESAWRGPSANDFSGQLEGIIRQTHSLSADGSALARRLSAEVAEWEETAASLGSGFSGGIMDQMPVMILPVPIGHLGSGGRPLFPGFGGGFSGGGGGGGGGGGWGEAPDMPRIDMEYHLIRGQQLEIYGRYQAGEMTWEEAMSRLEDMEESTRPDHLDAKLTLFDFGEAEGSASIAWKDRHIAGKYGTIDAALGQAAIEGFATARVGEEGLEAKIEGTAGLYAIHGEAAGQMAGIDMAGQAYLGAEINRNFEATINLLAGAMTVGAGVNAFAGMKAEGGVKKENLVIDGVDVGAKGALMAGAGIVAEGELGYDDGVFKADYDLGAAWGIGAQLGFEVELNVYEAGKDIAHTGWDVIDWAF